MQSLRVIALGVQLLLAHALLGDEPCKSTVVGDLRLEKLESKMYGRSITVRVWLPPGYTEAANKDRTYPTLYMLDGQGAFDDCTAFKGERELQLDETITKLLNQRELQPMIAVGIDSSSERDYEYSPYKNPVTDASKPDPIGKQLPEFFAQELIPYVLGKYRVSKNSGQVGIGGASLGAAAALHISLMRPDLFGLALLQSPSLLLGNGQLLRDTMLIARAPDRVVIGVGATEFDFPDIEQYLSPFRLTRGETESGVRRMTEKLADHLRAAYIKRSEVMLEVDPEGKHNAVSWARRMPTSIKFLFGNQVKRD